MADIGAYTLTHAGASAAPSQFGPPPTWTGAARCAAPDVDPDLFFSPEDERGSAKARRELAATGVCARCPVRAECLTYAIDTRQDEGVWGGATGPQRRQLAVLRTMNGGDPA